jgi:uncharacterized membrane protein YcaP (DUF421 family)
MDLARIGVRALVAYVYLLIAARSSGKRAVAEATPFDFVLALIMGDLIDDALWAEVSFAKFAAATGTLFMLDVIARMTESRFDAAYRLLNGRPTVLLANGRKRAEGLRREQLNDDDLAHLLRREGVDRRSEVRLAVLEVDSQLSVIKNRENEPVTAAERKLVDEARA